MWNCFHRFFSQVLSHCLDLFMNILIYLIKYIKIGRFIHKTVFLCLVDLPGNILLNIKQKAPRI